MSIFKYNNAKILFRLLDHVDEGATIAQIIGT
jgi:hypothetical protein